MLDSEIKRKIAKKYFNECWTFIEKSDRTALDDARSFKEQALQELVGIDEADASHIRTQIEELPF